jgi:hypothetical protein
MTHLIQVEGPGLENHKVLKGNCKDSSLTGVRSNHGKEEWVIEGRALRDSSEALKFIRKVLRTGCEKRI